MKVAFTLGGLNRGGTESLILDVCRKAAETPFEVVCIYRNEGTLSAAYHETDAKLIRHYRNGGLLGYMWGFRKLIKEEQIDIVHAQTPADAAIAILSLAGLNVKIAHTRHGFNFANANRLYRWLVFRFCNVICFVSEYEKTYYAERLKLDTKDKKYQVVPNGMDFSKLDMTYEKPDFLQNRESNRPALVMVGNFSEARSQDVIIRACAKLKENGQIGFDMYFVGGGFAGDETLLRNCKALVQQLDVAEIVHFLGSRGDVPAILQHADGFVFSTHHDTFGIGILEAMAAGLPVVCNDYPVLREITRNGEFATLFHTDDIDDCAEKMRQLIISLPSTSGNSKMIREYYSIERHIERLNEIYQSIR